MQKIHWPPAAFIRKSLLLFYRSCIQRLAYPYMTCLYFSKLYIPEPVLTAVTLFSNWLGSNFWTRLILSLTSVRESSDQVGIVWGGIFWDAVAICHVVEEVLHDFRWRPVMSLSWNRLKAKYFRQLVDGFILELILHKACIPFRFGLGESRAKDACGQAEEPDFARHVYACCHCPSLDHVVARSCCRNVVVCSHMPMLYLFTTEGKAPPATICRHYFSQQICSFIHR